MFPPFPGGAIPPSPIPTAGGKAPCSEGGAHPARGQSPRGGGPGGREPSCKRREYDLIWLVVVVNYGEPTADILVLDSSQLESKVPAPPSGPERARRALVFAAKPQVRFCAALGFDYKHSVFASRWGRAPFLRL